jgi:hypothetical protein
MGDIPDGQGILTSPPEPSTRRTTKSSTSRLSIYTRNGSDSLLVHAAGTARPTTPLARWHLAAVCRSKGDENISVMVARAKPERRERPTARTGLDGHGGQPAADLLSGMRYAVHIASQRLLANASGSVGSGSTGHR